MKAKLTGGQVVAAIFAGILGHLFFSAGWSLLWVALAGGLLTGLLGLSIESLAGQFSQGGPSEWFDTAGGLIGGLVIGAVAVALVVMVLGYLISAWILKGGKARRPWSISFWSIVIVAVLSLPLLLLYGAISGRGDGGLPFPLVAFLGTVIVGVLVWLWMTWAHRGPAVAIPTPPAATPVESAPAAAPVEAPAAAAVDARPAPDASTATPAPKKAPARKAPATKDPTA